MVVVRNCYVKVTWHPGEKPLEKANLLTTVCENIKSRPGVFTAVPFSPDGYIADAGKMQAAYANRHNGAVAKDTFDDVDHLMDQRLYEVADYVNSVAKGAKDIINLSGFEPTNDTRTPAQVPAKPTLTVMSLNGGIIKLISSQEHGYKSCLYILTWGGTPEIVVDGHRVQVKGTTDFMVIPVGKLEEQVTGIPAGTKLTCWCAAQNAAGISPLSNPVADVYVLK